MAYILESSPALGDLLESPALLSQKGNVTLTGRSCSADTLSIHSLLWGLGELGAGARKWACPGNERRGQEGIRAGEGSVLPLVLSQASRSGRQQPDPTAWMACSPQTQFPCTPPLSWPWQDVVRLPQNLGLRLKSQLCHPLVSPLLRPLCSVSASPRVLLGTEGAHAWHVGGAWKSSSTVLIGKLGRCSDGGSCFLVMVTWACQHGGPSSRVPAAAAA